MNRAKSQLRRWLPSSLFPHPATSDQGRRILAAAIINGILAVNSAMKKAIDSDHPSLALALFNAVRLANLRPDDYTFTFILKAIALLRLSGRVPELHSLSLKLGYGDNPFVQNSLIRVYFGIVQPRTARRVFDEMSGSVRDLVSWNSVISGYVQNKLYSHALHLFDEMTEPRNSISPDSISYVGALVACARIKAPKLGQRIHAYALAGGFNIDFFLGSSLIDMYAKCGLVEDARKVFDEMPDKNSVCWSAMIAGYAGAGEFKLSVEIFREMQRAGMRPDEAALTSVISACAQLGALSHGSWVWAFCRAHGLDDSPRVKSAMIDFFSKCGEVEKAMEIFKEMPLKDVVAWTAMIGGLAANGRAAMAVELFSEMEICPNDVTFLEVLSACSHGGFVETGFRYFREMVEIYRIEPLMQHYGCMVDLLGRARLLKEMELFIRNMPIEPDVVIWRALIFASKNCGNLDMAEMAAGRVEQLEMQGGEHGSRVMLANAYASASRWESVRLVREAMDELGMRKKPGCSSVEVDGSVHEFSVSDAFDPCMGLILEVLLSLNQIICSVGIELEEARFCSILEVYK
ncbi:pentatricopeptide repeat-containing protein At1g31430-like [Wolffia australiana]